MSLPARPSLSSLSLPAALVLALLLLLGAPDRRIAAVNCGPKGEILCKQTTRCSGSILLLNRCSTTFSYWHKDNPDETESEDGDDAEDQGEEPGDPGTERGPS